MIIWNNHGTVEFQERKQYDSQTGIDMKVRCFKKTNPRNRIIRRGEKQAGITCRVINAYCEVVNTILV